MAQDTPEYGALSNYVSGSTTADQAIDALLSPVTEALRADKDPDLFRTWNAVALVAAKTKPESQTRLVELVQKLRESPPVQGNGQKIESVDGAVWEDLPSFGAAMRENLDHEWSAEELSNFNRFLANLTRTSNGDGGPLDFSLYAIWMLRAALEEAEGTTIGHRSILAATAWLIEAADVLYGNSRANRDFEGKMAKPGKRFVEKSWRGFSEERWDCWKEEVERVSPEEADERTKEALRSAKNRMIEAERQ